MNHVLRAEELLARAWCRRRDGGPALGVVPAAAERLFGLLGDDVSAFAAWLEADTGRSAACIDAGVDALQIYVTTARLLCAPHVADAAERGAWDAAAWEACLRRVLRAEAAHERCADERGAPRSGVLGRFARSLAAVVLRVASLSPRRTPPGLLVTLSKARMHPTEVLVRLRLWRHGPSAEAAALLLLRRPMTARDVDVLEAALLPEDLVWARRLVAAAAERLPGALTSAATLRLALWGTSVTSPGETESRDAWCPAWHAAFAGLPPAASGGVGGGGLAAEEAAEVRDDWYPAWHAAFARLPPVRRGKRRTCWNAACRNLDHDDTTLLCGGCRTAAYCSLACHREAWPLQHRLGCALLAGGRV
jgi:hypothetical protein